MIIQNSYTQERQHSRSVCVCVGVCLYFLLASFFQCCCFYRQFHFHSHTLLCLCWSVSRFQNILSAIGERPPHRAGLRCGPTYPNRAPHVPQSKQAAGKIRVLGRSWGAPSRPCQQLSTSNAEPCAYPDMECIECAH